MKTTDLSPTTESILCEGWNVLVNQLGMQKAIQFVIHLEQGKGDSVKEIAEYWGDVSIEEIHQRVVKWKGERQ